MQTQLPFGWMHPALLLVGETVAYIWGDSDELLTDHTVTTTIPLKVKEQFAGRLRQLTVERVPYGCGALYPNPLAAGYCHAGPRFQLGLEHARLASAWEESPSAEQPRPWDFDVRWSLMVLDPKDELPVAELIDGRSAEVAIAGALLALLRGEQLDRHVAVTAMFKDPVTVNRQVTHVAGILSKTEDNKELPERIDEVLLAADDPRFPKDEKGQPRFIKGLRSAPDLHPVRNLREAYGRLADLPRLTRRVKQKLKERAELIVKQYCDPYIPSRFEREAPPERGATREGPKRDPVTPDEAERIALGQLPADRNRVWLLADSGMGKSMFLVHCEGQIASCDTGPLPLRLGAGPLPQPAAGAHNPIRLPLLSDFDWKSERDAILKNLADSLLSDLLPSEGEKASVDREDLCRWLIALVERGEVVFLLDAIDQTEETMTSLAKFLAYGGVVKCPTLVTGRAETRNTRSQVSAQAHWDWLWLLQFDEQQIREFLGPELARKLLPHNDDDKATAQRKQQWADLLKMPILLHEMRNLARDDELDGLVNREGVYDKAMTRLIKKGLESLDTTGRRPDDWSAAVVSRHLSNVAWATILPEAKADEIGQQNFTGELRKRAFEDFQENNKELLKLLDEISVAIRQALYGQLGYGSLAWRHLSYCEYFAGLHLADLDRNEQEATVQQYGRDVRWRWIFRYALACLQRQKRPDEVTQLATDLIRYGNPFLVFDAIDKDRLKLPRVLDTLCRWLVHQNWAAAWNYGEAYKGEDPPELTKDVLDVLEVLFLPKYRNSPCLHPAWQLIEDAEHPRAKRIKKAFLSEFEEKVTREAQRYRRGKLGPDGDWRTSAVLQLVPDERLVDLGLLSEDELQGLERRQRNFPRCPPADLGIDGVPFQMGSPVEERGRREDERLHAVVVSPFYMQRTPVTNAQYELFDPNHWQLRDEFSRDDKQPVIYVNWFMARMFALWLGGGARLPTEAEWEYACRAGTTAPFAVGDGQTLTPHDANFAHSHRGTTPAASFTPNLWGFYDMHGNVADWCEDWYDRDYYDNSAEENPQGPAKGSTTRVVRGGYFRITAVRNRSASRMRNWPSEWSHGLGFRLARSPSGK